MRRRSTLLTGLWLFLFFLPLLTYAQRVISGRIISEADQNPVAGASIVIKGSNVGTSSDVEGRFSIKANSGDVLVITGVGITQKETTLGDEATVSIVVKVDSKNLSEVVVTALGIKKETKRLGYSVQEVKGEDLLKAREANPVNGLAGAIRIDRYKSQPTLNPRVRGSSLWRRTRDQGSEKAPG